MISPDPAVRAGAVVDEAAARLFGIIESSYESVARLLQEVDETATDVGENLRRDTGADPRRREAVGLVGFKLVSSRPPASLPPCLPWPEFPSPVFTLLKTVLFSWR